MRKLLLLPLLALVALAGCETFQGPTATAAENTTRDGCERAEVELGNPTPAEATALLAAHDEQMKKVVRVRRLYDETLRARARPADNQRLDDAVAQSNEVCARYRARLVAAANPSG